MVEETGKKGKGTTKVGFNIPKYITVFACCKQIGCGLNSIRRGGKDTSSKSININLIKHW